MLRVLRENPGLNERRRCRKKTDERIDDDVWTYRDEDRCLKANCKR